MGKSLYYVSKVFGIIAFLAVTAFVRYTPIFDHFFQSIADFIFP